MSLFETGRLLHSSVGIVALISFWTAALAVKGSLPHRRAGRVYLLSMLSVMALSTLMVAGKAFQERSPGTAVYLLFLVSMVGTACWLTWFSVRRKREPERLTGLAYRSLATLLVVSGTAVFLITVAIERPVGMFLSLLGTGFGLNMWRLALAKRIDNRWWIRHHMNGVMLNFIATHDSFIALGIGSFVPELRHSVPRMLVALTVTAVALALRAWYGRRWSSTARVPVTPGAIPGVFPRSERSLARAKIKQGWECNSLDTL